MVCAHTCRHMQPLSPVLDPVLATAPRGIQWLVHAEQVDNTKQGLAGHAHKPGPQYGAVTRVLVSSAMVIGGCAPS